MLLAFSAWAPGLTPGPDESSTPLQVGGWGDVGVGARLTCGRG